MYSNYQIPLANNHISVDCVVLGFDGKQLKVLLLKRDLSEIEGSGDYDYKLPGSLIYEDEDLDQAAQRVLYSQAEISRMPLIQFKSFGSKNRMSEKDNLWIEKSMNLKIERIITIAYLSLVKISSHVDTIKNNGNELKWVPLDEIGDLAFDHNNIINEALKEVQHIAELDPIYLFLLLPHKFTASQLRILYEHIYNKPLDVRNFQKKINQMAYVQPLDEFEKNVPHRAARLYRFDKVTYNRSRR
jgi:hypothetical protein